jgi:hypothetical protein
MNLVRMKPALLWLLFLWQMAPRPAATPSHLRYQRVVRLSSGPVGVQACAVLDADVFSHAAPSLRDLRLFVGPVGAQSEVPYATTLSESQQQDSEDARILNPTTRSGHIVFDLEMPHRPYTAVSLDLGARDFIATAAVFGGEMPGGRAAALGTFTLFDLSSQHLARSTSIPLPESTYPYLHLDLTVTPAPGGSSSAASLRDAGIVRSASVPPSRDAQTVYVTSEQTADLEQIAGQSVATVQAPLRVPVERIAFVLKPGYDGDFSRAVAISAHGIAPDDKGTLRDEEASGTIFHVHRSEGGRQLSADALSVPVAIGSNMQQPAIVRVAVENGTDAPLPIVSVELQMRQRRICFDAPASAAQLSLYYGDSALQAPAHAFATDLRPAASPRLAALEPETANPVYQPRADSSSLTDRHPDLLWVSFLAGICTVALIAIRTAKRLQR